MSVDLEKLSQHLDQFVADARIPSSDRCDALIFEIVDKGIDLRPVVEKLLRDAGECRKYKEKLAAQEGHALVMERFIRVIDKPRLYAEVTRNNGVVLLPVAPEDVAGLQIGDAILIDLQTERIIGRDGQVDVTGEVVEVEARPAQQPDHVVVRHHEQSQWARLHHTMAHNDNACRPGMRVIYDPLRNFVVGRAEADSDGTELLVPPERLPPVRRENVGAPKPVVEEILGRVRDCIEHPGWSSHLGQKQQCGYCFLGPTGSGKSYHVELIATTVTDYLEEVTGQRISRLVTCDASQFWNSLFGSTEQRIATWAEKLQCLGGKKLHDREGREISVPLLICLEEADALLRVRGETDNSSHLFDRPLAVFLEKIQSFGHELGVPLIWVALSNRGDLLDPAALRRIGARPVYFGTLSPEEAAAVLEVKIPADRPIRGVDGRPGSRAALIGRTLGYLYGPAPKQELAEVHFVSSARQNVHRYDLVTPSLLEEALSAAADRCLARSRQTGELDGIDADDVVRFLHRHFVHLAHLLRPHNLGAHCPEWFAEQALQPVNVVPLVQRVRRPRTVLPR